MNNNFYNNYSFLHNIDFENFFRNISVMTMLYQTIHILIKTAKNIANSDYFNPKNLVERHSRGHWFESSTAQIFFKQGKKSPFFDVRNSAPSGIFTG